MAWEHALPIDNGRISVYHAADLSTLPLRPTCFPRYFLHLGYDWSLCLAQLTPAIRCDFDVVSSGLPPPFLSLLLSPLVASAVSGLRTLFVWFCFFCFCYPRLMLQHFLTSTVVTLRPFALYLPSWRVLSLRKVMDSNHRVIADLLLSRELPYHSANLPCSVCCKVIATLSPSVAPP